MKTVAIIGKGFAAKLAALYIKQHIPTLKITFIDADKPSGPLVGESTVDISTQFLRSLNLSRHLTEKQLIKNGLSYYYRCADSTGQDSYVMHETPGVVRLPAYNLNRWTFDAELKERVSGISDTIKGQAIDIKTDATEQHDILVRHHDKSEENIKADYVIDASGRGRFLAKKFDLKKKAPFQRSSYWFRLENFDQEKLRNIRVQRETHVGFDPYYATHHFFGKGYWIWMIPIPGEDGQDFMSIGYTFRPEICGEQTMDFERFCEILKRDHPQLVPFIESGDVFDECKLYKYMYESSRYFDKSGWFLIGDAAFTFDPINSAGIATLSHQIPQVAAIIKKDLDGDLTQEYVESMEKLAQFHLSLQDSWSHWYHHMDSPLKMAWTLFMGSMAFFHFQVPDFQTGAFLNGGAPKRLGKFLKRRCTENTKPNYPFRKILDEIEMHTPPEEIHRKIESLYNKSVPSTQYHLPSIKRGKLASEFFKRRAMAQFWLLKNLPWSQAKPKYILMALRGLAEIAGQLYLWMALKLAPGSYDTDIKRQKTNASPFEPNHAFLMNAGQNMAISGVTSNTPSTHMASVKSSDMGTTPSMPEETMAKDSILKPTT